MTEDPRIETIREAVLYVYWCPVCEIQTEKPWHVASRPHPLIPQFDEEHECQRIEVRPVVRDARKAALAEAVVEALEIHGPSPFLNVAINNFRAEYPADPQETQGA